jgi:nucleotide-binding universal stress UspA family protein
VSAGVVVAIESVDEARAALDAAGALADGLGGRLHVVHVLTDERERELQVDRPESDRYVDVLVDEVRRGLQTELGEAVSAAEVEVLRGEPGPELVRWAERRQPDYLVIGVRNRSRVGKLLFGSTAQTVLLQSSVPVVAVPG